MTTLMDRRILGLTMACLMAFSLFMVVVPDVSDADGDDPQSEVTALHGIIFDIPADKERTVIAGVTVTTWTWSSSDITKFDSDVTDENGEFEVGYNDNVRFISFTMEEFTVKGVCSELFAYGESGLYEIDLGDSPSQVGGVHNLYDRDGFTALISRTSAMVFGNVSTVINGDETPVKNADVSLSTDMITLKTTTDSDGNYSLVVSKGVVYQMSVTADGFNNWSKEVTPSEMPTNIIITQKDHSVFLGMDLSHTIAVLGIVIVVLLALITIYLGRRPEKVDGLYVVNDLKPREKLGDDSKPDE